MINAVPFLFGPLESPPQVTGQAGGAGLDHAGTTENPTKDLFRKILRNQTTAASFLNNVSKTRSGEDGGRGSNQDWLFGTQALSGDTLPSLYLASLLENNGQEVPEEGAVVGNYSISLRAEGVNGDKTGGQVESPTALFEFLPGNGSQDGSVVPGNVAPLAFLQGKPGGEIRQPPVWGIQTGLPPFAGAPASQTAGVGSTLADQSAAPLVTTVDSERVLQNALAAVAGKSVTESDANQLNTVYRVLSPVQETGPRLLKNPPSPIGPPQESLKPANTPVNQAFPVPEPFEDTPAGMANVAQLSQNRLNYVSRVSSVLSESPANGKESSIGIPLDLLADANVSLTGDRSRDVLEATGKAVGVDPNAGQGLNHGMGNPTHSQPGFQQSSSSPGSTIRMAEERVPDLPGPALQRLQMEVQLSETNRVQIDVGVQHRQVYASLLMDQATLKNLAVQFVPQLEEQLTQGEMELQEFSAEVRDHQNGQESDTRSDGAGTQTSQRGMPSLHQTPGSLSHRAGRADEQGFHLVA